VSFGNGNGNGEIVISTPLRTGIGTFGGALKDVPATDLGSAVGREVLSRSGVEGEQVDQVIVGNILSAGQGMNPGRQVGIKSGLPVEVPGMTLNRMCGSGLQAIVSAAQEIALGDADVVLAGGIENMDMAPFLMTKGRYGYRMGMPDAKIYDHMVYDGLWDVFNNYHMGVTATTTTWALRPRTSPRRTGSPARSPTPTPCAATSERPRRTKRSSSTARSYPSR
jgi:acetyl-CoA C-acetyltransferase